MAEEGKLIGEITHYFDNINVAVLTLNKGKLEVGDEIRIAGGEDTDFTQKLESMEIDHDSVEKAKKGDEVAIKVEEKVRRNYKVYKL